MRLEGEHLEGFEHHVVRNPKTGTVDKFPTDSSLAWQVMTPEEAERDLAIQDEFGVKRPVNVIDEAQTVEYEQYDERHRVILQIRKWAEYLAGQPFVTPAHEAKYAELLFIKAIRDDLIEKMLQRDGIKRKYGLGLDLLGGQGFGLLRPALDPRVISMRASLGNLLVAEEDIETNGHWTERANGANGSNGHVAKKGEVLLIDNRLMPIGQRMRRPHDRILAPIMRRNEEFQDAALWTVLEGLGVDSNIVRPDERFNNGFKRLVRRITQHATPKMIAGAEEMEKMN